MPPAEPQSLTLAGEFPSPTHDDWRELVSAVLARSGVDGDPEETLSHTTYDGITVKALYTAADAPEGRAGAVRLERGWDVRTRHDDPDAERANAAVLEDLERGATSLWLVLDAVDYLGTVLRDVYLDLAPVVLQADTDPVAAATALVELARSRGVEPRGSLGADPIGARARSGVAADLSVLGTLAGLGTSMQVAVADGTVFHDAGASDAQELGIATAVGVAYLRALTDAGLSVDDAFAAIGFRWSVTADQFSSIAKLRAARRVWDRVAELSGASDERRGQHQHAVTSRAMLTRRDPWVNMLRTTVACFAAAVGGADVVTVAPFDAAIGRSDAFARRIARNTHAVLHDESSLARVADAAGGSWYVESLTEQLAQAAWTVFTDIEKAGGALAALDDGTIEAMLAATRDRRNADVAHRRAPITGVSEFAFVGEAPVERATEGTPGADGVSGVLPAVRYAEPFEALRDRADAASSRPKVFLATLGPPAVHSARSGFAANLFQAGGLECVTGPVEEFAQSGAKVACLCSSDKVYADDAADAAAALRDAGAVRVWLAGAGEFPGVDGRIFAGCDALEVLRLTFDDLEVRA